MIADEIILGLPKVSLKTKELLPEYSGIYYVLDQNNVVMYIGKAKNLQKRWQGNSHHRIDQLKATRKREFYLYYEKVSESRLDPKEKSLIKKYRPELNDSPVTTKEIYFSELVLQETLRKLDGYIVIFGVHQKNKIIEILFDYQKFAADFKLSENSAKPILNLIFKNRRNAAVKWNIVNVKDYYFVNRFIFSNLPVNGYNVIFNSLKRLNSKKYTSILKFKCDPVDFVQESVPNISVKDFQYLQEEKKDAFQGYSLYEEGLMPYLSTLHKISTKEILRDKLQKICCEYQAGKRGIGSQKAKVSSSLKSIDNLLKNKPIEITKVGLVHYKNNQISLYVKCFDFNHTDKKISYTFAHGKLKGKYAYAHSPQKFSEIYLLSGCNPKIWRLLKDHLSDFVSLAIEPTSPQFPDNTGYVKKLMISPRRYITTARLSIKFEGIQSRFSLPFGQDLKRNFTTFEAVKTEITRRLNDADLPLFKLTFTPEKIVTKGRR